MTFFNFKKKRREEKHEEKIFFEEFFEKISMIFQKNIKQVCTYLVVFILLPTYFYSIMQSFAKKNYYLHRHFVEKNWFLAFFSWVKRVKKYAYKLFRGVSNYIIQWFDCITCLGKKKLCGSFILKCLFTYFFTHFSKTTFLVKFSV